MAINDDFTPATPLKCVKTPAPDLDVTARYHLEDGTVTDGEPSADRVTLAELRYPCPHCDHPNVAAHTPPLIEGLIDQCDHCDRAYRLTRSPGVDDDDPEILPATAIDYGATRIANKRRARILGERLPDTAVASARRGKRGREYALFGGLIGSLPLLFGTALATAKVFGGHELIAVFAAMLGTLLWAGIAVGAYRLFDHAARASLGEYLDDEDDISVVVKHVNMAEHGRRVSDGDAELYVPPSEDADRDLEPELA